MSKLEKEEAIELHVPQSVWGEMTAEELALQPPSVQQPLQKEVRRGIHLGLKTSYFPLLALIPSSVVVTWGWYHEDMVELNMSVNETWKQFPALRKTEDWRQKWGILRSAGFIFLGKEKRYAQQKGTVDTPVTYQGPEKSMVNNSDQWMNSAWAQKTYLLSFAEPHLPTCRAPVAAAVQELCYRKVLVPRLTIFQNQEETLMQT